MNKRTNYVLSVSILFLSLLALAGAFALAGKSGPFSAPDIAQAAELAAPAALQAQDTVSVTVQAPAETLQIGQVFTVVVEAAQAETPLSGFQFDLVYNPSVIAYARSSRGDFMATSDRTIVCPPAAQPSAGRVRLACASTGLSPGATGAGTLYTLTFRAVGGGGSELTLQNILLPDDDDPPTLVDALPQHARVTACIPVGEISISGPSEGDIGVAQAFTATVNPITGTATTPITFTWRATELTETTVHPDGYLSDTVSFTWEMTGTKIVTVTADNGCSQETETETIIIEARKIYLPLIQRSSASTSQRVSESASERMSELAREWEAMLLALTGLPAALGLIWYRSDEKRRIPWRKIWSLLALMSILSGSVPIIPAHAAPQPETPNPKPETPNSKPETPNPELETPNPKLETQNSQWADVDDDHDIDATDLRLMAEHWNCASGEGCYEASYDRGGMTNRIDAFDLASLGNQYDIEPPQLSIASPAAGAVVGGSVQVSGAVSDTHAIESVTVNGTPATVASGAYQATISLESGNQTINVIATDELGAATTASRLVGVDAEGPFIEVHAPKHRQSIYTLRPTLALSYTDFYTDVNAGSLEVLLIDEGGSETNVTPDLTVGDDEASGTLSADLSEDTAYTLTASLEDVLGNLGSVQTTFFVPTDAAGITPPEEPKNAGWISGRVYDSSTCEGEGVGQDNAQEQPVRCDGLAGAEVRLSYADNPTDTAESSAITGTLITGPDGFFAFPVAETDRYWLRIDKDGFTYGQREAEIVRQRSTPVNEIYLTPLDSEHQMCDAAGCVLTSTNGMLRVQIPPGAITGTDTVDVSATFFDQVEFLPSGGLPEGTWETYGFNLGGDSEYQFTEPITVWVSNTLSFPPNFPIPLGFWNQNTQEWEHAGTSRIDANGEWVVFTTDHFSTYDCNDPVTINNSEVSAEELVEQDQPCAEKDTSGSAIILRSGVLRQDVTLPEVMVMGEPFAPTLRYDSNRANPSEVIEVKIGLDPVPGIELGDYVQAELYIEGEKTDNFTFSAGELGAGGEIGHFRYLWDGRDAQGRRLPTGVYQYAVRVRIPYHTQYYFSLNGRFGGPPDYANGATGVYVDATAEKWLYGTVTLDSASLTNSPFGVGWALDGLQRLHEDENGRILIESGCCGVDEYYFPGKNLLEGGVYSETSRLLPMGQEGKGAEGQGSRGAEEQGRTSRPPGLASPPPFPRPKPLFDSVGGVITESTTWTLAGSPYVLTSDVVVTRGVTLTVNPGVQVMGQDSVELKMLGHLHAVGTVTEPITFTSSADSGANQWAGLVFDGGTGELEHATVRYGGDGSNSGLSTRYSGSNIAIQNGTVRIESSRILSTAYSSSYTDYGLYAANSRLVVSDTLFAGNGNNTSDYALRGTGGSIITVTGSTFQGNLGYAMYVELPTVHRLWGNDFSGNGRDRVRLEGGEVVTVSVMKAQTGLEGYQLASDLHVPSGATLTVEPGVQVMGEDGEELQVSGHLAAVGTVTDPITFTSSADSGANQWAGLVFDGGTGELRHATVRYGGDGSNSGLPTGYSGSNIAIQNVLSGAVRIESSQILSTAYSSSYTDYGLYAANSRLVVSDTLFAGNGNNTSDYALYATGTSTTMTITDNIFQNNAGYPLRIPAAALSCMQDNIFIENGYDRVLLYGDQSLASGTELELQDGLSGYEFDGTLTVPEGVTMTIEAGTSFHWVSNEGLVVHGDLLAIGTNEQTITFTSRTDNGAGQWDGITFGDGTGRLEHATVRYAETGLAVDNGDVSLRHGAVTQNQYHGIHLTGAETQFRVAGVDISGNGGSYYGLLNETGELVDARYNWWGHISGPTHASNPSGTGDRVSDNVIFEPWLEEDVQELGIINRTANDETTLTYSPAHGTYTRHYPDGTEVHFNGDGAHDHTLDPLGNRTAYTYDADGRVTHIEVTPADDVTPRWTWTFTYTAGALSAIADPAGRVTTFEMDKHGDLVDVAFPDGNARSFAYDGKHRMTHHQDENESLTTYIYDKHGRIQRLELPPRQVYDPATAQFTTTQEVHTYAPSDVAHQLVNDLEAGDPVSPTDALVSSKALVAKVTYGGRQVSYRTDAWGWALGRTDGLGRETRYTRDEAGRVTRMVTPEGNCTEFTYDGDTGNNTRLRQQMGPAQCALAPDQRDPAQVYTWRYTFDSRFHDKVTSETDPLGHTTYYEYDDAGNLTRLTLPPITTTGGVVVTPTYRYTYTAAGLLTEEQAADGTLTRYEYTQGTSGESSDGTFAPGVDPVPGLLTRRVEDVNGVAQVTEWRSFNAAGDPQQHIFAGEMTYMAYDELGQVISTTDASGATTLFAYDGAGRVIEEVENANGTPLTTTYTYDGQGHLFEETRSGQGETVNTRYYYDADGNLAAMSDPNGQWRYYEYDAAGQLVAVTDPLGHTTHYTYNGEGRLAAVTDPQGHTRRYAYTPLGQVRVFTDSLGHTTVYTYDAVGNLTAIKDPRSGRGPSGTALNGQTWRYQYNAFGQRTAETDPLGHTTVYTYDAAGVLIAERDPTGAVTRYVYDGRGYLVKEIDPLGRVVTATYDAWGNTTAVTTPVSSQRFAYDSRGEIAGTTDALGHTTSLAYDDLGNITQATDPTGATTHYDYDGLGRLTQVTGPRGHRTSYDYDANGNLIRMADPLGNETTFAYDDAGQLASRTDPLGRTTAYGYDELGNTAVITDAMGQATAYVYDAAGRLVQTDYSRSGGGTDGTAPHGTPDAHFTYDGMGNLLTAVNANVAITQTYDGAGNLIAVTAAPDGFPAQTLAYAHDAVGRVATITTTEGAIHYTYNLAGELTAVDTPYGAYAFAYDDGGRLIRQDNPNGTYTELTYDVADNLLSLTHYDEDDAVLADYAYAYDESGAVTATTTTSGTIVYGYDAAHHLTGIEYPDGRQMTYEYDAAGRRISQTDDGQTTNYHYDAAGQLLQAGGETFAYDANGQMVERTAMTQTTIYTYNAAGQLVGVAGLEGTFTYGYDPFGKRVLRTDEGTGSERFVLYDGLNPLLEVDPSGDVQRLYIHAGVDRWLGVALDGQFYVYHTDRLGSIVGASDTGGDLAARYRYSPFGELLEASGDLDNPLRFVGREELLPDLYDLRARAYAADLGRFLSPDPMAGTVARPESWLPYSYAAGDPLNLMDPLGLEELSFWWYMEAFYDEFASGRVRDRMFNGESGRVLIEYGQGVAEGTWSAITGMAEGLVTIVENPLDAWNSVANLGALLCSPEGRAKLKKMLGSHWDKVKNAPPEEQARMLGQVVGEIAGAYGVGKGLQAAKASKYMARMGKVMAGTRAGQKAMRAARILSRIGRTNTARLHKFLKRRPKLKKAYDMLKKAQATEAELRDAINTISDHADMIQQAICGEQPEEQADDPPDTRCGW